MVKTFFSFFVFLLVFSNINAETLSWIKEPAIEFDKTEKKWWITFELNKATDVEVSIIDSSNSKILCHLAAGMLGSNSPAPFIPNTFSQKLSWDGKDDFKKPVADITKIAVMVRAGMSVKLNQIYGGDPYAFYSKEMGQGDHAAWRITGLEIKKDGRVFVMGNVNNYGPLAIREYTIRGEYKQTVFPYPAGKDKKSVAGWGIYLKEDGTYSPQYSSFLTPELSKTLLSNTKGRYSFLIPTVNNDSIMVMEGLANCMNLNVNGDLPEYKPFSLVLDPILPKNGLVGEPFSAFSSDGKFIYVSGLFAGASGKNKYDAEATGFWHDGQIWKIDCTTKKAEVFFAIDDSKVISENVERNKSPITDTHANRYATFHGIAVDSNQNVFVCDRLNKRVVVLDKNGKLIREIPVSFPDDIALIPNSNSFYITTRFGDYHKNGEMNILKFNDWTKDEKPAINISLGKVGMYYQRPYLAVGESEGIKYLWVAYTTLPVLVYQDKGNNLELIKDFYEAGTQRMLDFQHTTIDQKTNDLYLTDGFGTCYVMKENEKLTVKRCMIDSKTPLFTLEVAIDSQRRYLYRHGHIAPVSRYLIGDEFITPDSKYQNITPAICNYWAIGRGMFHRGTAVSPDGNLAVLGAHRKEGSPVNYGGPLNYYVFDAAKDTCQEIKFEKFGGVQSAGVRFDSKGNMYAGKLGEKPSSIPKGFEVDSAFNDNMGRIYKYSPDGTIENGNLYTKEPDAYSKIYNINYGVIDKTYCRSPRFGVDGFGRVYYPTSLSNQVSVIDTEGNKILTFGTYGNRDSLGGLEGDKIATKDIPLAWPNSVEVSDNYIYVGDIVNARLLQLEKKFELSNKSSNK